MSDASGKCNRLAQETSPYLKQHATNPVDWYPWGPEALERARQEDKPIFLSVGYSACHWCHVMEHESFENEEIAAILNEHFISIKVDREERPDLDQIYMTSVQMISGQGGWPMSVFLMPDLRPFFGGTYFPPENRYGRPGFKQLLLHLHNLWTKERAKVEDAAGQITGHLQQIGGLESVEGDTVLDASLLQQAVGELGRRFDPIHGGFGEPPKFLHTMDLRALLRAWKRFDWPDALHMVRHTLDKMAMGGIYDHLGGGFARYSTDARWLVPHFEKMLYDNALLVVVYLEAYQATGEPFYAEIARETLAWTRAEMTSPEGPFYSTLDADSEGVEGKFYVWTFQEVEAVLGRETAKIFCSVYGIQPEGNWEGNNILNRQKSFAEEAQILQKDEGELRAILREARQKLFEVRSKRIWPGRDEKVLTSWNGLMIAAFAESSQVLDNPDYAQVAAKAAEFILDRMRNQGRLYRTWSQGSEPKLNAYLEDYAFLADALVSLYEATFDPKWITAAAELADVMIEQFWDRDNGAFFYTGEDHEKLIARNKDPFDNAIPSGNAMAATALMRLAKLTGNRTYQEKVDATLEAYRGLLNRHPLAASQMLQVLDFQIGPTHEYAIVGDPESSETKETLQILRQRFHPNKVVAMASPGDAEAVDTVPLLRGMEPENGTTIWICKDFACQAPVVGPEGLREALEDEDSSEQGSNG